jgi:predicted TIM-barrel fold metal-dependent hydrolase
MQIIGLEEHFVTVEVLAAWRALDPRRQDLSLIPSTHSDTARRLADLGDERLRAMDDAGVDAQVLSLSTPGVQGLDRAEAVALQTAANDVLADAVHRRPDRFGGLATLATPDPSAAAAELERAVTELGLDGAMIFGRTGDRTMDASEFWPIYEAAEALRAPLHLHPQSPPPAVRRAYYGGYGDRLDAALATHGIGWHYESGIELLRLILAGVFDRFPDLQIVVGHWGEIVLFYLDRIATLDEVGTLQRPIADYFRTNIHVTPSGVLSHRYLQWAVEVIGADRIMFATDYPFGAVAKDGAQTFLREAALSDPDRAAVASGNWARLRHAIRR